MVVHKCDRCGREMKIWATVKTDYDGTADMDYTDAKPWLGFIGDYEFCYDCMDKIDGELRRHVVGDFTYSPTPIIRSK